MKTAWMMNQVGNKAGMIKVSVPKVAHKVIDWAIQVFGGGCMGNDHFLGAALATARCLRLADGPNELHRNPIALIELKRHRMTDPLRRAAGLKFFA